ncbi:replication endonuclease, partial [Streptomyces sp. B29(2018)]|uniref:replication endonuclease n=1 Tax=Streptomyces sp. B29(2018) TaxID=2485016 RepID=UPI0013E33B06
MQTVTGGLQLQQQKAEWFNQWKLLREAKAQQRAQDARQAAGPAPIKNRILARYHYEILCRAIEREYERREKLGEWVALRWLEGFEANYLKLNIPFLNVCSHDRALKDAAETMATKCEREILANVAKRRAAGDGPDACRYALQQVEMICKGAGANMPDIADCDREDKHKVAAVVMRLCNAKWWRGQIRKIQARQLETAARQLGLTCKKTGGYVSGVSLLRRRQQKRRNRELLENTYAENDAGQVYTLAQLSDLGVSNPVNRRNELMARIRGCEEWAEQHGENLQAVFLTATCPSRFHAYNRGGKRYDNWDGSTPIQAQEWLNERWRKLRAMWNKAEIRFYGLRIAEPHHDGCPHWHLLLWFDRSQVKPAMKMFQSVWRGLQGKEPDEDCAPFESGAEKRRTKVDYIKKDSGG